MQNEANIEQILDFYLQAGVDEVIGDAPVNQFDRPAPPKKPANLQPNQTQTPKPSSRAPIAAPLAIAKKPSQSSEQHISAATDAANSAISLDELKSAIENFEGCNLKSMAMNTVFARGNPDAPLMVIDRAPSAEEDRAGQPFASASGTFLAKMMNSIGLSEADVYLASSLPWRPPGGRTPTREEQAICLPFILRHIELASPKIILICGEAAAFMLNKKVGINKLRGKWEDLPANSHMVSSLSIFHPTFLMEHPASKKMAWSDLLKLKAALASIS